MVFEGLDFVSFVFDVMIKVEVDGVDLLMIDIVGCLQNCQDLMEELVKIVCVICKKDLEVLYNILLVLDVMMGQNVFNQVKVFQDLVDVLGFVMIKLDGMVKGGVLVVLVDKFGLLIYVIGVGEQIDDLLLFDFDDYVKVLVGLD